jgi:predicted alpha/beta-fold hydrolase
VLSFDKNDHAKYVKSNMLPFEKLFFELGSVILKNAEGFLAVSPKSTVQKMKKTLSSSIKTLQKGGDIKKLKKLNQELSKIQAMGGFDSIVPSEGLVFKYKGNYYKFTGAFAPINQITGMLTF